MEDSLRYLAEGSMAKFVAFMQVGGFGAAGRLEGAVLCQVLKGLHTMLLSAYVQLHASTHSCFRDEPTVLRPA
jgi:hypothetical protein